MDAISPPKRSTMLMFMKIQKVKIKNFRTFKKCDCFLLPYTVFVGKNNAGKSNLMKALDVFFNNSPCPEDFRIEGEKTATSFQITLNFVELNPTERDLFSSCLLNKGKASEVVSIRMTCMQKKGNIESLYEYATIDLDLSTSAAQSRYGFLEDDSLTKKTDFLKNPDVPEEFKTILSQVCDSIPSGSRFGKKYLTQAKNRYKTQLIKTKSIEKRITYAPVPFAKSSYTDHFGHYFFIPAVQDVTKETKFSARSTTNLSKLMHYIFAQMQNQERQERYERKIREILTEIYQIEDASSEINLLRESLNRILNDFDGSQVRFDTELPSINKVVRDSLKIYINDGVETEVEHKGHGLQRYFMVILFKAWANRLIQIEKSHTQSKSSTPSPSNITEKKISPSVFFAIEEPELFLHPQYQRLMRHYLLNIAESDNNQVILNTHSPNFIDISNYQQVARVIKHPVSATTKKRAGTEIVQPLSRLKGHLQVEDLTHTHGRNPEIRQKYHEINELNLGYYMNPHRSELFFADQVVLVEGETEKLLFERWAEYFFPDAPEMLATTTYVDMNGKFNAQLYEEMLNGFEIPYVIIIDNDRGSGDSSMNSLNYHIKKTAEEGTGTYIELEGDFEQEFQVQFSEENDQGKKKFKPYYAYRTFFDRDGTPNESELERIRIHPKWQEIAEAIYHK